MKSQASTSTQDHTSQVSITLQASQALIEGQVQDPLPTCSALTALVAIAFGYCAVVHKIISKVPLGFTTVGRFAIACSNCATITTSFCQSQPFTLFQLFETSIYVQGGVTAPPQSFFLNLPSSVSNTDAIIFYSY
jgi:hypothetical protein